MSNDKKIEAAKKVPSESVAMALLKAVVRARKVAILTALAVTSSACAGMEVGGKLGVYRVDEHQSSQRTYNKPLKCLFVNCDATEPSGS